MLHEYVGNIWERQSWETEAQYTAFLAYRDLGSNRSVDAAFEVYDKNKKSKKGVKKAQKGVKKAQKKKQAGGGFRQWAKGNEWIERVAAFDTYNQRELDAAKLEAKKQAIIGLVEQMGKSAIDAGIKILEKPSLEKVRKKYTVMPDGKQVLTEVITEQQSVLAAPNFVREMLQMTMPEFFGKKEEEVKTEEPQIVIVRNVIAQSDIHSAAGGNILPDNAAT